MAQTFNCSNCKFFQPPPPPPPPPPSMRHKKYEAPILPTAGLCRFYPTAVTKAPTDWCGQWKHGT